MTGERRPICSSACGGWGKSKDDVSGAELTAFVQANGKQLREAGIDSYMNGSRVKMMLLLLEVVGTHREWTAAPPPALPAPAEPAATAQPMPPTNGEAGAAVEPAASAPEAAT